MVNPKNISGLVFEEWEEVDLQQPSFVLVGGFSMLAQGSCCSSSHFFDWQTSLMLWEGLNKSHTWLEAGTDGLISGKEVRRLSHLLHVVQLNHTTVCFPTWCSSLGQVWMHELLSQQQSKEAYWDPVFFFFAENMIQPRLEPTAGRTAHFLTKWGKRLEWRHPESPNLIHQIYFKTHIRELAATSCNISRISAGLQK